MGLFAKRPDEPSAWAALPGEPLDDEDEFDLPLLPSADPLALGAEGVTSVSISLVPAPPADATHPVDGAEPDAETGVPDPDTEADGAQQARR